MNPFGAQNQDEDWFDEQQPFQYQFWNIPQAQDDDVEDEKDEEEERKNLKRKRSQEEELDLEIHKVRRSFKFLKDRALSKELILELEKAEAETLQEYAKLKMTATVSTTISTQLLPIGHPPAISSPLPNISVNSSPNPFFQIGSMSTSQPQPQPVLISNVNPSISGQSMTGNGSSPNPVMPMPPTLLLSTVGPKQTTDTVSITPPPLRFIFMDVGQGNGTLILCPHGEKILVDLGCASNSAMIEGKSKGIKGFLEPKLQSFLIKHTNKQLDYLIISHGDRDHLNMIEPVLEGFTVGKVICGGAPAQYQEEVKERKKTPKGKKGKKGAKAPEKKWRIGQDLGEMAEFLHDDEESYGFYTESPSEPNKTIKVKDVEIFIVGANAHGKTNKTRKDQQELKDFLGETKKETYHKALKESVDPGTDTNASCIVLMFKYRGQKVLISADATFSSEKEILTKSKWKGELESYALIGGHHGSSDSFSRQFLRQVNPSWLLFSADVVGQFAHPTIEVVSRALVECPNLKDPLRKAWGPHGIVVGRRLKTDQSLVRDLPEKMGHVEPLVQALIEFKQSLKLPKAYPKSSLPAEWIVALTTFLVTNPIDLLPEVFREMWRDLNPCFGDLLQRADLLRDTKQDYEKMVMYAIDQGSQQYIEANKTANLEKGESLPPLLFWAVRFSEMEDEYGRLEDESKEIEKLDKAAKKSKRPGGYALWDWLQTDYNLFATMETAESGVYWMLEIDGNGVPWTARW